MDIFVGLCQLPVVWNSKPHPPRLQSELCSKLVHIGWRCGWNARVRGLWRSATLWANRWTPCIYERGPCRPSCAGRPSGAVSPGSAGSHCGPTNVRPGPSRGARELLPGPASGGGGGAGGGGGGYRRPRRAFPNCSKACPQQQIPPDPPARPRLSAGRLTSRSALVLVLAPNRVVPQERRLGRGLGSDPITVREAGGPGGGGL